MRESAIQGLRSHPIGFTIGDMSATCFQVLSQVLELSTSREGGAVAMWFTYRGDGSRVCEGGGPADWVRAKAAEAYPCASVEEVQGE